MDKQIVGTKILMVTMALDIGGAETHVVELARELKKMGYNVSVASNGGVYCKDLQEADIPHYKIPLHSRDIRCIVKSYRMLKALIRKEDFDIVHAHARIPGFLCGLLHKTSDFAFTTTAHLDFEVNGLLRKITNWGQRTLAVSRDIGDYLVREYNVPENQISLTVNGIDTDKFSPDIDYTPVLKEFALPPDHKRIVYISRIDTDRSAPAFQLCEIAGDLVKEFPDTDIIIVGGGNDFQRLKALADTVNSQATGRSNPLITLTGSRQDIPLFAGAADIFCGVSRSALEAMACGKPVIVTGNQGYLGVFSEETLPMAKETNFCCRGCGEATKEKLLADLRHELSLTDAELQQEGAYNRSIIKEYYSARRMAEDYLEVYRKLPVTRDFRRSQVVLSGYYGFDNSGDDMILKALIQGLREDNPLVRITVLAKNPGRITEQYNVKAVNRYNPFGVLKVIKGANALIFGGGTLLQDATSTKSLRYYLGVLRLANMLKTPVYIYANGIGPLRHSKSRYLTSHVLNSVDKISVRDCDSQKLLRSIGVPENLVHVTADAAFLLSSRKENPGDNLLGINQSCYGVSLRLLNDYTTNDEENLITEVSKAIREIYDKYNLAPVYLCFQPEKDKEIIRRCRELSGVEGILPDGLTSEDFPSVLKNMKFVLGMRLHSLIFGVSGGVPVIGIAYDPKVTSFMKSVENSRILDPETISSGKILKEVSDILADYDREKKKAREWSDKMADEARREIHRLTSFYRNQ